MLLFKYSSYLNVHIKLLNILQQLIKTFITICQATAKSLLICKTYFQLKMFLNKLFTFFRRTAPIGAGG